MAGGNCSVVLCGEKGLFSDYTMSIISLHRHNRLSSTPDTRGYALNNSFHLTGGLSELRCQRMWLAAIRFHGHAAAISSPAHNADTAVLCSTRKMNAWRRRDVTAAPAYHLNQRSASLRLIDKTNSRVGSAAPLAAGRYIVFGTVYACSAHRHVRYNTVCRYGESRGLVTYAAIHSVSVMSASQLSPIHTILHVRIDTTEDILAVFNSRYVTETAIIVCFIGQPLPPVLSKTAANYHYTGENRKKKE